MAAPAAAEAPTRAGFGLKRGAIASSVGHDSHNITVIGATDDLGLYAVKDKLHVHDLHATILALLGIAAARQALVE